jgi:Tol biopolymer transport system component
VVTVSGGLRRLVRAPGWPGDWKPTWSANGRMIAFVRIPDLGPDQVWVVRPDGSGRRRVATAAEDESVPDPPDWSADSRRIAYMTEFVAGDIYLVRPNGTGRANLTPSHDAYLGPRWAPSGSGIAYSVMRPCGMNGPDNPCVSPQIVVQRTPDVAERANR